MKYKVEIEVAFDCQCTELHITNSTCPVYTHWMSLQQKHDVTLEHGLEGPNGNPMFFVSADEMSKVYNLLVEFCGGDIEQALYELGSVVITHDTPMQTIHELCSQLDSVITSADQDNMYEDDGVLGEISHLVHAIRVRAHDIQ